MVKIFTEPIAKSGLVFQTLSSHIIKDKLHSCLPESRPLANSYHRTSLDMYSKSY